MSEAAKTEEKLGLKETKEAYDFCMSLITKLAASKADDGKISTTEWIAAFMTTAPEGVKAVMGASKIDDEMKDLDSEETNEVAAMGVMLMQAMVAMFMSEDAKEA